MTGWAASSLLRWAANVLHSERISCSETAAELGPKSNSDHTVSVAFACMGASQAVLESNAAGKDAGITAGPANGDSTLLIVRCLCAFPSF